MDKAQPNFNTSDHKPSAEFFKQQDHIIRQPTPVSQLTQPLERQTRSCGHTDIDTLFGRPSPPDMWCKKPVAAASPVNTFIPINGNEDATPEDPKVARI